MPKVTQSGSVEGQSDVASSPPVFVTVPLTTHFIYTVKCNGAAILEGWLLLLKLLLFSEEFWAYVHRVKGTP